MEAGNKIKFGGYDWVVLDPDYEEDGQKGVLVLMDKFYDECEFNEDNINDYRKSKIRSLLDKLAGEICVHSGMIVPHTLDLAADDGMTDYNEGESCKAYIWLLSCDEYRKYRPYIPKYDSWWWTRTAWSCHPDYCDLVRYVYTSGVLGGGYAYGSYGVVPACIISQSYLARRCASDESSKELMSFSAALEKLKQGERIAREGWNGKGQYIELAKDLSYTGADGCIVNADHEAMGKQAIAFVGTSGVQIGWLASQADMLSDDWYIAE